MFAAFAAALPFMRRLYTSAPGERSSTIDSPTESAYFSAATLVEPKTRATTLLVKRAPRRLLTAKLRSCPAF